MSEPWKDVNDMRRKLHAAKDDPFEVDQSGYDPDAHYHVVSTDKKGHSAMMRFPVPPGLKIQAEEIVARQQFPFRTANDIARDAFFHGLQYLSEMSYDPDHILNMRRILAMESIAKHGREMEANAKFVEDVKHHGTVALNSRDWPVLQKIVSDAVDFCESAHEPYLSQLEEIIKRFKVDLPEGSAK